MAEIIAKKAKSTAAISGDVSSDGLSAMLGDEGDLQSMLLQSVKNGTMKLDGVAEDWISQTSDRARELLENIGKPKAIERRLKQIENASEDNKATVTYNTLEIPAKEDIEEFSADEAAEIIGYFKVTEKIADIITVAELKVKNSNKQTSKKRKPKKNPVSDDQLAFDLFAV